MNHDKESGDSIFHRKFDPCEYINMYYPAVDDIEKLLHIASLMHKNASGTYVIGEFADATGTAHEAIENVAIFDFYRVVVEHLIEEFPRGNARILDIGGGPTIYQHIGLSLVADHIVHAEYLESNRKEVLCWLQQEEGAYVWDTYFELVCRLFQYGDLMRILKHQFRKGDIATKQHARFVREILETSNIGDFKHRVREAIGDKVMHCDMLQSDLGLIDATAFDIVTSNFVAESAACTHEQWERGMENVLGFVAPKGYFVQTAIKNSNWYQVGNERLPAVPVDADMINRKCRAHGFRILYQKILEGSNVEAVGYDGMIFTLAKRV